MKYLKIRSYNEQKKIVTVTSIVFLTNVILSCCILMASVFITLLLYENVFSLFDSIIVKFILPSLFVLLISIFPIYQISISYPIYVVDKSGIYKIGLLKVKYYSWSDLNSIIINDFIISFNFQGKKLNLFWNYFFSGFNSGHTIVEQILGVSEITIKFPKKIKWISLLFPVEYRCTLENDKIIINHCVILGKNVNVIS